MQGSTSPAAGAGTAEVRRRSRTVEGEGVDRWLERGILGLVLLVLVFGPLAFGAVGAPQILVIQALTIGVVLLWTARMWVNRPYRLLWPPICWAVTLFIGYTIARYRMVVADHGVEFLARQELILVLIYGLLFFAILNNLSRQESTQIVSVTLLALGTVISLYALYQFLTKSGRVLWTPQYPGYIGRGSGTYVCPNHMAGLLEMILPLGLAYTLTGRFKPTTKVFLGYAAVAIFTGIGVSVSRGAWASTGLALLVFFGLLVRQRGQRLAGIIFLVLLLGGFVWFVKNLSVLQRRIGITMREVQTDDARIELWRPGYQMWKDHFWWGVGPAHFDQRFRSYRPDDIQMRPLYVHNDYLNALVDYGLVGGVLIGMTVGLLYVGVFQSWKFVKRSNDLSAKRSNRSAFVVGAAAGLGGMLAHSAFDFNMHIPANAVVAITFMALITGHLRFATERYWFRTGWLSKGLLSCVLLASAGYLSVQAFQRTREQIRLSRAERARDFASKVQLLKTAHAIEPQNCETTYELGEMLRLASWEGVGNYRQLATEAVDWFQRGARLNPFDPYNYLRWGMCLHWLERPEETQALFDTAIKLDPRNYYIQGHVGWHYFQLGELDKAEQWFEKSVYQAHWHPDPKFKHYGTGLFYLDLIKRKRAAAPSLIPDPQNHGLSN